MYFGPLAEITAGHLRIHIRGYLDAYGSGLVLPKQIETASLVGGILTKLPDITPAYAVNAFHKQFSQVSQEDLMIYEYEGNITGIVTGNSHQSVDELVKAHAAVCERFVQDHVLLPSTDNRFTITGFHYLETEFSGAEQLSEEDGRQLWADGFRVGVLWQVSEDGPMQHD